MVDILHRIGAAATREDVYAALTTAEGLAGWWTTNATGDGGPGGEVRFGFEPGEAVAADAAFTMKVLDARPGELVLWEVVDGPKEWVGTRIRFALSEEDGLTIVGFAHEDWRDPGAFMAHCSTKWATFLLSLKQLVETGTGAPAPYDVKISNWH